VQIPFNYPYTVGRELEYVQQAIAAGHLSGNGEFTQRCQQWLETHTQCQKAFLTSSCTDALEMAAILANIQPGDEVIMPSYTFVSTANAFVLRGAVPVFVDIRPDTLNLDETQLEAGLTNKTKAIVPVHYGGVSCEMDAILAFANQHRLWVIEDAAQGIGATYHHRPLGSFGHLGTFSFHETKNIISGEGGALLVNHPDWVERAEILWEKGTNRSQFFRGQVDKYTWVDVGSSYLPSDMIAAFLWAQLEAAEQVNQARLQCWQTYHTQLAELEQQGKLRRPIIPAHCQHNAHMYYILLSDLATRTRLIQQLRKADIAAVFHYVPLHSSPAGRKYGRCSGVLHHTDGLSDRLLRLPLWFGMGDKHIRRVVEVIYQSL
jgi:dTDP-4-amino-4,6-dideoxygalactose transaminase